MNPALHSRHARSAAQLLLILGSAAIERGLAPMTEFNLGEPDDYRVPDAPLMRPRR